MGATKVRDETAPHPIEHPAAVHQAAAGLAIRRADPHEFAAIDHLITTAYAHDYGPQREGDDPMHAAARRADAFEVWVALDASGRLVGSVTTRAPGGPPLHEDVHDDELDLRLLGVSPTARRLGVGAALMRHIAGRASRAGFGAVVLKTAPNMTGAHRLYESLGFARAPERDGLWIGGARIFDLYTYRLPLREGAAER